MGEKPKLTSYMNPLPQVEGVGLGAREDRGRNISLLLYFSLIPPAGLWKAEGPYADPREPFWNGKGGRAADLLLDFN